MGLYTRSEWAALCRTTTAIVTTNINRGKIELFEKKIDSENKINNQFFVKYNRKAELELQKNRTLRETEQNIESLYNKVVEKASDKVILVKKQNKTEKERKEAVKKSTEYTDLIERKQKADTELQEFKAQKEQMQLEKMAGKLIPTELVFHITRIHNQSIFATFQNDAENLASIYCDILADGDRKYLSEITEKISEKLKLIIKRAEEVAEASIENAVEEYAETRNRGERK